MGFQGMGRNPHDRRKDVSPRHRRDLSTEELDDIQAKLEAWDRVKQTPAGDALYALARPIMDWASETFLATTGDLLVRGYPVDSHELLRAEARAVYWEWHRILHEPLKLLERLSELSSEKDVPPEDADSDDVIEP